MNIPTIREQAIAQMDVPFKFELAVILSILLAGAICLWGIA